MKKGNWICLDFLCLLQIWHLTIMKGDLLRIWHLTIVKASLQRKPSLQRKSLLGSWSKLLNHNFYPPPPQLTSLIDLPLKLSNSLLSSMRQTKIQKHSSKFKIVLIKRTRMNYTWRSSKQHLTILKCFACLACQKEFWHAKQHNIVHTRMDRGILPWATNHILGQVKH